MTEASVPAPRKSAAAKPPTTEAALKDAERAAIILSLLEPETAKSIATHFERGAVDRAINAFHGLKMVPKEQLIETIRVFLKTLEGDVPLVAGGERRATELANRLRGEDSSVLPPPEVVDQGSLDDDADAEAVWAYLRSLEPKKLAKLLRAERPAVIAAVLGRIDRQSGAAVLEELDDAVAVETVRLMIAGRQPPPRTFDAIAESLRRNVPGRLATPDDAVGDPTDQLAEVFNCLPAARQDSILMPLKEKVPDETERLASKLLRYAILHERLPKTIVPQIFREVDNATLDKALKHGLAQEPETTEFLLGCISQRLAEQIRERVEEMPKVKASDGEAAQTELVRTLITWAEEDRFQFKPPPGEEEE